MFELKQKMLKVEKHVSPKRRTDLEDDKDNEHERQEVG
jgi:hypothetical protein